MTSQNDELQNKMSDEELNGHIRTLGIRSLENDNLDAFIRIAKQKHWAARTIVENLIRQELLERERRSLAWRHKDSRIGSFKSMADFDWGWPEKIDRNTVERMATAEFVDRGDNVILVGTQGLGKTMIAKNIVYNAVHRGHTALFIQAAQMLIDLGAQDSVSGLERRLKHYTKPKLLCIDEVGYLSYDQRAADFLFQVVSRRYESKSVIITTNLAFNDWLTVFPGATSVASLIDRLVHHSEISLIEGESYRKRQAKIRKAKSAKSEKSK
jgi:DNA replication protein DnaC